MRTVAYCRVSTNKEEQLDSLERQRIFFLEYAKKHNYDLINIYADEGKSGTTMKKRLQLQQLLIDGKRNEFELVLIKDVSRLARNTVDFLTSIRKLKSYGIRVVFVNYDQTSSDSSEFMLTMLSAIAQEESANISKRIKFGKKVNAEKGRVPNICYGYDKIDGKYYELEINKKEAEVVRKIFEMYTQELIGTNRIAKVLNQKGIKTKRNCQWTQTGVRRILSNEIFIGKVVNQKEEVVDFLTGKRNKIAEDKWIVVNNPELQIVSEDIFKKANDMLVQRKIKYNKTSSRTSDKHIFSKLIWCKNCNYNYRRIVRKYKNTYIRWVCNGRNSNGVNFCSNKNSIDEKQLLDATRKYFLDALKDMPKYREVIISEFYKTFKRKDHYFLMEKDYKKQLDKLVIARNKYIRLYKEDIISLHELQTYITSIEEEKECISGKLSLLSKSGSNIKLIKEAAEEIFCNLDVIIERSVISNVQYRRLIDRILVGEDGIVDIYVHDFSIKHELKPFT